MRRLWKLKYTFMRWCVALFIASVLLGDAPARLARLQLAALPDFDYVGEIQALTVEGRYGEATMIADASVSLLSPTDPRLTAITDARARAVAEQESWIRRAKSVGMGALSGRGSDLESLVGALTADFFLVGDIRDLVLEGGKQLIEGDSDELVLLLSFVGVVTTLAPEIDWAPAIVKAARRAGSVTDGLAKNITSAIKRRDAQQLTSLFEDVATISRKASPGGTVRILRRTENAQDLADIAKFINRTPHGAFVLHVTGDAAPTLLRQLRASARASENAADAVLTAAAKKGTAGARFLSTDAARILVKPHWVIGITKAVWKGNAEKLVVRLADRFDTNGWWMLPLACGWAFFETLLLGKGLLTNPRRAGKNTHASSSPSDGRSDTRA